MKSQIGVTIIELVIVLVITVLIATVAISSGKDTLSETDVTEVYVEMTSMKNAINAVILQKEMNSNIEITDGKYYDDKFIEIMSNIENVSSYRIESTEDWYVIYGNTSDEETEKNIYDQSMVKNTLGLDSINHSYMVNYETGEVELLRPLIIDSTSVRTYSEVRAVAEK